MNTLICGSMDVSTAHIRATHHLIFSLRIRAPNAAFIVGDNPRGVDRAAIDTLMTRDFAHVVYGIHHHPRYGSRDNYIRVMTDETGRAGFAVRDRYMVDRADRVYAIWNGESAGTQATIAYARERGKPVFVWTVDGWQ